MQQRVAVVVGGAGHDASLQRVLLRRKVRAAFGGPEKVTKKKEKKKVGGGKKHECIWTVWLFRSHRVDACVEGCKGGVLKKMALLVCALRALQVPRIRVGARGVGGREVKEKCRVLPHQLGDVILSRGGERLSSLREDGERAHT